MQQDGIGKRMTAEPLRRSGRPDQQASEELVRHIVDTAARLFIEHGYAAISIEQVATAAGSGKQTIYRHFRSKEGLFTEVINRQAGRLIEIAEAAETTCANPIEALQESCRLLFDFVLTPDVISLQRIMIAELSRFPALGEHVLDNCMAPFKTLSSRLLRSAGEAGQLRLRDPDQTQTIMMGLLAGWPMQQALLGKRPFATPAERDAFFEAAWALFLRGAQ
jgi:AcrR family transcriptional regulator